jgi:catechol O-methyltransferase
MNKTATALALHITSQLIVEPQPISSRLRLFGAILRELSRSVQARLGGQPNRERAALTFVRAHAIEGDAESVLGALDRFARERRFMMNLGDRKGLVLDELVTKLPVNARVLELGTYCGYSAIRMARLVRGGGQVVSIEANARHAKIARAIYRFAGVEDQVRIFVGETSELISKLDGPFDLVLMDHNKEEYLVDLWRIEENRLLEPGSTVVAEKVGPLFEARAYLGYVRCGPDNPYRSRYVETRLEYHDDHTDGMEISVWRGAQLNDFPTEFAQTDSVGLPSTEKGNPL